MKKGILLLIAPLFICVWVVPAFAQEDMKVVDDIGYLKRQRPPAVFQHDAHNEKAHIDECNVCHHVYDEDGKKVEDESSEDESCSDCHELKDVGNQPGLTKAFHWNCIGCHRAKKLGPIMCGTCHVR